MFPRAASSLIVATALALLAMGWCATRTVGARVIGEQPPGVVAPPVPPAEAMADAPQTPVPGRSARTIALVPGAQPVATAAVNAVVQRERTLTEPRLWSLRIMADDTPPGTDEVETGVVVLVLPDASREPGVLAMGSVAAGRAAPPWLRRALQVAGARTAQTIVPQAGWAACAARAGVGATPLLGRYLNGPRERLRWMRDPPAPEAPVPAIALRYGIGRGTHADLAYGAVVPTLQALVDQLQTEPALPPLGPDQFAEAAGRYLTPSATRWLWVFPLLPLTIATGARYAQIADRGPFAGAVVGALRRVAWWCVPCVGGAALLLMVPARPGQPLTAREAQLWAGSVLVLGLYAAFRYRRLPYGEPTAYAGGALVLDVLWSTYLMGVLVRPWGTGLWLAPAVLLWPWVVPAAGLWRFLAAFAWLGGCAPAVYWLVHLSARSDAGLLGTLGWLAGTAPPGSLLLGGFATAVGLQLAWWAAVAAPLPESGTVATS